MQCRDFVVFVSLFVSFCVLPNRDNSEILLLNFDFESSTCEVEDVRGKVGARGQADSVTERP